MISKNYIASSSLFYQWHQYRCAYNVYQPNNSQSEGHNLLLIHPIGVGLSKLFWQRFCQEWYQQGNKNIIYNPDLLGCGESDKPRIAYIPQDWAEQLQYFLQNVIKKPVIIVVQGALFPVAIELLKIEESLVKGMILAGPPAWKIMTNTIPKWRKKVIWNILDFPSGNLFYRYARREKFLENFSKKQLFGSDNDVDTQWLQTLQAAAADMSTRHAVFSFLAGFWRKDYAEDIASIDKPTLVVFGEAASSINTMGKTETSDQRVKNYSEVLPQGRSIKIPGRNVLPYESTTQFVGAIAPFVKELT
ncbi:MAG: alpha/beta hydrolase [Cyanobacteria bacterium P01_A01_bin.84]